MRRAMSMFGLTHSEQVRRVGGVHQFNMFPICARYSSCLNYSGWVSVCPKARQRLSLSTLVRSRHRRPPIKLESSFCVNWKTYVEPIMRVLPWEAGHTKRLLRASGPVPLKGCSRYLKTNLFPGQGAYPLNPGRADGLSAFGRSCPSTWNSRPKSPSIYQSRWPCSQWTRNHFIGKVDGRS